MRAPAASRLVADPLEHYDDRAPGSELLLHHHEEAQAASAYRPQPSTSAAAPAAPPPPVRVATEEVRVALAARRSMRASAKLMRALWRGWQKTKELKKRHRAKRASFFV